MIAILCSGSRGDTQPYIALAQELIKLNKDVKIAAGISNKDFVEGYGIEFYPLSADYKIADIDPKMLEDAANSTNPLKMLLTFNKMKKYARFMVDEMYNACFGSEMIIYHPGCTIGYFAAKEMGIPAVLASPFPLHATKEVASVIAYGKTKMPIKASYKMLQGMLWMASKTGVSLLWKEKFGQLPNNFDCPFEKIDDPHIAVTSCSNYVFKRPNDWTKNTHQYGYWLVKENADYTPPKDLQSFLDNGKKPIYFGFGSVSSEKDSELFIKTITDAVDATGKRAVICGMTNTQNKSENIFYIDNIPHTWLFPKCSAVCHHGGAGTTAAGFAAGVPSIIVPFSNDQFAWAHRAYDLGVGSKPVYKKNFNSQNLVKAIEFIDNADIKLNAQKLSKNIATENGAKKCAEVISKLGEK